MNALVQPLDRDRLAERVAGIAWIRQLDVLDTVDSTNEELKRRAAKAPAGAALLAEEQTAGRGRRGHAWHSPRGSGLYLSVLLRPTEPIEVLTRWTLAGAVAAVEACRRFTTVPLSIDWPNDLMLYGRKLGGVLVELRSAAGQASELIVGIGINVSPLEGPNTPPDLLGTATSLAASNAGRVCSREDLAAALLEELGRLAPLIASERWPALRSRWEALAPASRGTRVAVTREGRPPATGVTAGIAEDGALRVQLDGGGLELVRLSDSVRELEG